MNSRNIQIDRFILMLGFFVLLIAPFGCGAVGPPIPPEDIGIEAKIREQEREHAQSKGPDSRDLETSVEEETVDLPSFYPIGTR